tara:strand:+ start:329 stop:586 length:258 start_codon:yes stop_codon:yes gene_type:complete
MRTKMNKAFKSGLREVTLNGIFSEVYLTSEIESLVDDRIKLLKVEILNEQKKKLEIIHPSILEKKKIVNVLETFINPFKFEIYES